MLFNHFSIFYNNYAFHYFSFFRSSLWNDLLSCSFGPSHDDRSLFLDLHLHVSLRFGGWEFLWKHIRRTWTLSVTAYFITGIKRADTICRLLPRLIFLICSTTNWSERRSDSTRSGGDDTSRVDTLTHSCGLANNSGLRLLLTFVSHTLRLRLEYLW